MALTFCGELQQFGLPFHADDANELFDLYGSDALTHDPRDDERNYWIAIGDVSKEMLHADYLEMTGLEETAVERDARVLAEDEEDADGEEDGSCDGDPLAQLIAEEERDEFRFSVRSDGDHHQKWCAEYNRVADMNAMDGDENLRVSQARPEIEPVRRKQVLMTRRCAPAKFWRGKGNEWHGMTVKFDPNRDEAYRRDVVRAKESNARRSLNFKDRTTFRDGIVEYRNHGTDRNPDLEVVVHPRGAR